MAPNVEISIPTATIADAPSPYTLYNITIRLPLRSFVVQKRYSEFASFHDALVRQVGAQPPVALPGKSWFSNTNSNETLREERRKGLERYLRAINESEDPRWRQTSVWRSFLNLPSQALSDSSAASKLHKSITEPGAPGGGPITDPVLWLDCYREMKAHLHETRLHLTRRDQATTPQKQHESSAQAKSSLVKAGSMIGALEEGLKNLSDKSSGWGGSRLGEGEIRRRKDLIASAKKEKDGLENLHNAMVTKSKLDNAVASMQDKDALVGSAKPRSGRVLGKETDKTRELDNQGVLQLQKQTMEEQDRSVEELMKIVARQKELGIAINNELEIQNELLRKADEDVDMFVLSLLISLFTILPVVHLLTGVIITRLQRKIDIGKRRLGKIS
ncbi:SNARE complex subunit (Vam7) [Rasamsonia emersonii CBS 393.64]|uniref:SNARE complex subunit (Vam7) n=1 Tax=Rasamsonia emersonii (strain ATCC 16479 / CBS 393.64 / IMI 116815) TaxID=1408163 RepID=A0A0F4YL27_RASE3|nr:SNARE complex subunit (Vam7) [Rasamsonia emersonii CBS 393.64]KKA18934.1 SNARE complex subunit (Vam7) [Rasamsonia emersonii CBS 393.64]